MVLRSSGWSDSNDTMITNDNSMMSKEWNMKMHDVIGNQSADAICYYIFIIKRLPCDILYLFFYYLETLKSFILSFCHSVVSLCLKVILREKHAVIIGELALETPSNKC